MDSLRADHVGCYGYKKQTTPFIDKFAKESLVFTNCVTTAPSTVPAFAALFTSQYPYLDGVVTEKFTLKENVMTLPEFLKHKGYETFAVVGHEYVKRVFGFSRGFDVYDDDFDRWRYADEITARTIDLIKNRITKTRPFFLWVHFREPHSPYNPPQFYVRDDDRGAYEDVGQVDSAVEYTIYGMKKMLTQRQIKDLILKYDGNIRYADACLQRIFMYLQKMGLLKNSLIVFTADHGESLGEHWIFDHNHLYYGILRVPLIIRIPDSIKGVINNPVSSVDIVPTIFKYLGVDTKSWHLRGHSLVGEVTDSVQFSEAPAQYSIIKDGWRLCIDTVNDTKALFHVGSDFSEYRNVIGQNRNVYDLLFQGLEDIPGFKKGQKTCKVDYTAILDDDAKERLKSLGYLN